MNTIIYVAVMLSMVVLCLSIRISNNLPRKSIIKRKTKKGCEKNNVFTK